MSFRASALSVESTRLDAQRDRAYSAFKSYVKVYLNDDDGEKSEAAEPYHYRCPEHGTGTRSSAFAGTGKGIHRIAQSVA
jgi:hypothetical protein